MSDLLPWRSECDLAAAVVASPLVAGWDVRQEVPVGRVSCDIVALRHSYDGGSEPLRWIIECKLSLGPAVLAQAVDRKLLASRVSVAVPAWTEDTAGRNWLRKQAEASEIGIIVCSQYRSGGRIVRTVVGAPPVEHGAPVSRSERLTVALHPDQRTGPKAGSAGVRRIGRDRALELDVAAVVRETPGIALRTVASTVSAHDRTPRETATAIRRAIEAGQIPAVRAVEDHGLTRLYPAEVAA